MTKTPKRKPAKANASAVRYSRAGDTFHYRWAARRCLRLIPPGSPLESVFIEGSKEDKIAGEFAIDVSEYYVDENRNASHVEYYQHKHSTVRVDAPFPLSELKSTVESFAARFKGFH